MKKTIVLILICLSFSSVFAQSNNDKMLLTNMKIQMECTEAIDSLYNFNFEAAEKQFLWLKQSYPDHPLPYFLMALSQWWKIVPNDEVTKYDDRFYAYIDTTIDLAKTMHKNDDSNPEPMFFLAAAYGFKARRQSDNNDYTKSAFTARKSLEYMDISKDHEVYSPEFLFGDALYNYYREWLQENSSYRFLKPILILFRKGDRELGLQQLEKVSKEAFYSRIEALYHLMEIYAYREDGAENMRKGYEIAQYLASTYPNNAYFITTCAELAYKLGKRSETVEYSNRVREGIKEGRHGYGDEAGRKVNYFLGTIYHKRQDTLHAKLHFMEAVEYAKKTDNMYKGYTATSLMRLSQYADNEKDTDKALKYAETITKYVDKDHPSYKWADKYIDEHTDSSWWKFWD